jgi:transketolase
MRDNTEKDYRKLSVRIRAHVLEMSHHAHSSHVGSALSMVDLLTVLYGKILRVNPECLDWSDRDRFILSKGHACTALYAILAEKGFFSSKWLEIYGENGSHLLEHIAHNAPGVETSTGSLGHGLPIGCGMALAGKRDRRPYRIFVMLSDGECDEGATWEAALFAPHHRLDNLVAIIDHNKLQAFGKVKEVLDLEPLADKWRAFNWAVQEIDGHDFEQIEKALSSIPLEPGRPSCIVAHTVKGKGISFMENQLAWHYKSPNDEQLHQALDELGVA